MNDDLKGSLRASTGEVRFLFDSLSPHELERRPAPDEWNGWEIAYHLFDIERWYIAKLCEAASEDRAEALQRFMGVWARLRDEAQALAAGIPPERLDRAGLLGGVPDWTPRGLIAAMAAHDREHVAQAVVAAGRTMEPILHITTATGWERARRDGVYRGDTLDTEGFIHCSTARQVVDVANARFGGTRGLLLLRIEPARVAPEIKWEGAPGGEVFPHIYGPLNLDAVTAVLPFEPRDGGSFALPVSLSDA